MTAAALKLEIINRPFCYSPHLITGVMEQIIGEKMLDEALKFPKVSGATKDFGAKNHDFGSNTSQHVGEENERRIFAMVRDHGPISVDDIAARVCLSKSIVAKNLKQMMAANKIGRSNVPGEGRKQVYHLPKGGAQ